MDRQEQQQISEENLIREGQDQEKQEEEEVEVEAPHQCFQKHNLSIKIQNSNFSTKKYRNSLKVLYVHLAYGLTFLVQIGKYKIQHYTWKGSLLKQIEVKFIKSIFMADDKTAILLLKSMDQDDDEQLCQINLRTYQKNSIPFRTELKHLIGIQVFTKSKTFCIKQQDIKNNYFLQFEPVQKIKLTYYKYPLFEQTQPETEIKPIYISRFAMEQNKQYKILKLNNEFMIGVIKDETIENYMFSIYIHSPEKNQKRLKKYTIGLNFQNQIQKIDQYQLKIMNVWEYRPDTLYINCQIYPIEFLMMEKGKNKESCLRKLKKSYNFQWNYKSNDKQVKFFAWYQLKNTSHTFYRAIDEFIVSYTTIIIYQKIQINDRRRYNTKLLQQFQKNGSLYRNGENFVLPHM